jgi:hypothetical protein
MVATTRAPRAFAGREIMSGIDPEAVRCRRGRERVGKYEIFAHTIDGGGDVNGCQDPRFSGVRCGPLVGHPIDDLSRECDLSSASGSQIEARRGAETPKLVGCRCDRSSALGAFCRATVPATPRQNLIQAKNPGGPSREDHDPSRGGFEHGIGDFARRA